LKRHHSHKNKRLKFIFIKFYSGIKGLEAVPPTSEANGGLIRAVSENLANFTPKK